MEAPNKVDEIKAALAAVIAFCTSLWGWVGWAIIALFAVIVLDYVSGTWAAMSCGEWSSQEARKGLWHKLGEIFALLVAIMVDLAITVIFNIEPVAGMIQFRYPHIFTLLVTMWYIFTELGSIIENAAKLGAPMPKWLVKIIKKLQEQTENAGDDLADKISEKPEE